MTPPPDSSTGSPSDNPPGGAERRKHPRIPMTARVTVHAGGDAQFYFVKDLSRGGAFILAQTPLPIGQTMRCEISIKGLEIIHLDGQVVRHVDGDEQTGGFAVEFDEVSAAAARLLADATGSS